MLDAGYNQLDIIVSSCGTFSVVPTLVFSLLQELQPIDWFVVEEYMLDVLYFLNGWLVARVHVFCILFVLVPYLIIGIEDKSFRLWPLIDDLVN